MNEIRFHIRNACQNFHKEAQLCFCIGCLDLADTGYHFFFREKKTIGNSITKVTIMTKNILYQSR